MEAEYLYKNSFSSNDTIEKILFYKMYKILEERLDSNSIKSAEEGRLDEMIMSNRPRADFYSFHEYINQVISNLEKMEADTNLYINNLGAVHDM